MEDALRFLHQPPRPDLRQDRIDEQLLVKLGQAVALKAGTAIMARGRGPRERSAQPDRQPGKRSVAGLEIITRGGDKQARLRRVVGPQVVGNKGPPAVRMKRGQSDSRNAHAIGAIIDPKLDRDSRGAGVRLRYAS